MEQRLVDTGFTAGIAGILQVRCHFRMPMCPSRKRRACVLQPVHLSLLRIDFGDPPRVGLPTFCASQHLGGLPLASGDSPRLRPTRLGEPLASTRFERKRTGIRHMRRRRLTSRESCGAFLYRQLPVTDDRRSRADSQMKHSDRVPERGEGRQWKGQSHQKTLAGPWNLTHLSSLSLFSFFPFLFLVSVPEEEREPTEVRHSSL